MTQSPEYRRLARVAAAMNKKAANVGSRGRLTADDLYAIELIQQNCSYCGISLEYGHGTFDHVKPFDRGGVNDITNVARSCLRCNRRKFTKSPDQLRAYEELVRTCPICGRQFRPRYAEWQAGRGTVCSRSCAARSRWVS